MIAAATKAKLNIEIELACASFTQAARALRSGGYAAILPQSARVDLPATQFTEIALPFLKRYKREFCLLWHPRLALVRPVLPKAIDTVTQALTI